METKLPTTLAKLSLGIALAIMVGLLSGAVPVLAGSSVSGNCVTASVGEPIRLPTGEEHASGRITLCVTRHYSPVSTLHKTYVDGRLIGLLQSRRAFSEGATDSPFMIFRRDIEGRLNLYGFATPAGQRMETFHLGAGHENFHEAAIAKWPAVKGSKTTQDDVILLADTSRVNGR